MAGLDVAPIVKKLVGEGRAGRGQVRGPLAEVGCHQRRDCRGFGTRHHGADGASLSADGAALHEGQKFVPEKRKEAGV